MAGNTVQLDATGLDANAVQLTDSGGITLAGGNINGTGTIATATTISGWGTVGIALLNGTGAGAITASGGIFDLTGQVNQGAGTDLEAGHQHDRRLGPDDRRNGRGDHHRYIRRRGRVRTHQRQPDAGDRLGGRAHTFRSGKRRQWRDQARRRDGDLQRHGRPDDRRQRHAGRLGGPSPAPSAPLARSSPTAVGAATRRPAGTLDLTGQLTGAATLEIYGSAVNTLKIDAVDTAISVIDPSGNGDYGTLEIGAGGGLTLTDALNTTTNATIKLDGAGATFTDAAGIYLANSPVAISGDGVVNASITASGQYGGEIKESGGGTLDLNGALIYTGTGPGGAQLQTGSLATDVLALGPTSPGTATSDTAIYAQVNGLGTLDIDAGVTLTAQWINVGAGNLDLLGAGAQVNLTQSIELSGGDVYGTGGVSSSTGITGYGTYTAALDGGSVEAIGTAPGEVLTVGVDGGQIDATTATAFSIGDLYSNSDLALKGVVGTATVNPTITFTTGSDGGTLDLTGEGSGSAFTNSFHGVISGFIETARRGDQRRHRRRVLGFGRRYPGLNPERRVGNARGCRRAPAAPGSLGNPDAEWNFLPEPSSTWPTMGRPWGTSSPMPPAIAAGHFHRDGGWRDGLGGGCEDRSGAFIIALGALRKIVWIGTRAYSAPFRRQQSQTVPHQLTGGISSISAPAAARPARLAETRDVPGRRADFGQASRQWRDHRLPPKT